MTQPTNIDYKSIEEQVEEKSTQILEGARYVTGNQYPEDSEEYKAYQSGFEAALAMVYIELTGTPKTIGKLTQALQERDRIAREEIAKRIEELPETYDSDDRWGMCPSVDREELDKLVKSLATPNDKE